MKLLHFYRIAFITVLTVISPLALLASAAWSIDKPVIQERASIHLPIFQDSTASRKKPSNDAKDAPNPPQDVRDERLKEAQRREIKQVPRSIPKLKPQPVPEGIKIRRPPVKGPKRGMGQYRSKNIPLMAIETKSQPICTEIQFIGENA